MSENVIVEYLKTVGNPVSKKEILESTKYDGDFKQAMRILRKRYYEIETTGTTTSTKYVWKSESKNQEGYSDPTAFRALKNAMRSTGTYPMRQHFGEIWSTSDVTEDMEGYLIVAANEGVCICYQVYPAKKPFMKNGWICKWEDDLGPHYISAMNPFNISERKFGKMIGELDEVGKARLKDVVREALDISIASEKIENTREKELEVLLNETNEKNLKLQDQISDLEQRLASTILIPEGIPTIDQKDLEIAVLKAKLEVYERVIDVCLKR